ncbi:hypothetical protein EMIT0324P_110061 [Pseudomonas chlororaphis]
MASNMERPLELLSDAYIATAPGVTQPPGPGSRQGLHRRREAKQDANTRARRRRPLQRPLAADKLCSIRDFMS